MGVFFNLEFIIRLHSKTNLFKKYRRNHCQLYVICNKTDRQVQTNTFFAQFLYQNHRTKLVAINILVKSMA